MTSSSSYHNLNHQHEELPKFLSKCCTDGTYGEGGTIPRTPNHCGVRRKVPAMSQVLSSIQYVCFRKISRPNKGVPNLPRAPFNFVTLLITSVSIFLWMHISARPVKVKRSSGMVDLARGFKIIIRTKRAFGRTRSQRTNGSNSHVIFCARKTLWNVF